MKYEDLLEISDPYIVYNKFKKIYPPNSDLNISTRKNKKYMIWNPENKEWFHFGSSDYSDYTKHRDKIRRNNVLNRNHKWADAELYNSAYALLFTLDISNIIFY